MNHLMNEQQSRQLRLKLNGRRNWRLLRPLYTLGAVVAPMILTSATAQAHHNTGYPGNPGYDNNITILAQDLFQQTKQTLITARQTTRIGYGRRAGMKQQAIQDLKALKRQAKQFSLSVSEYLDIGQAQQDIQFVIQASQTAAYSVGHLNRSVQSMFNQGTAILSNLKVQLGIGTSPINMRKVKRLSKRLVNVSFNLVQDAKAEGRYRCRKYRGIGTSPRGVHVRDHRWRKRRGRRIPARRGRIGWCRDAQKMSAVRALRQLKNAAVNFQAIVQDHYQTPMKQDLRPVKRAMRQAKRAVNNAFFSGSVEAKMQKVQRIVRKLKNNLSNVGGGYPVYP